MNNKISLPELSEAVALTTGYNVKACELFLRELFAIVAETVAAGENVKIKGIGSFKSTIVEERKSVNVNTGEQMIIPSHRKVSFSPEKALAEAINAPFAIFEPVELNDDVTDQMLNNTDVNVNEAEEVKDNAADKPADVIDTTPVESAKRTDTGNSDKTDNTDDTEDTASAKTDIAAEPAAPLPPVVSAPVPPVPQPEVEQPDSQDEPELQDETEPYFYDDEDEYPKRNHRRSHFGKGVLVGALCAVALCVLAVLAWWLISPDTFSAVKGVLTGDSTPAHPTALTASTHTEPTVATSPEVTDTTPSIRPANQPEQAVVPTETSDKNVNKDEEKVKQTEDTQPAKQAEPKEYSDKITKHRYLTTMAREYYGNYNLWPLIYDYNKSLGHPDRIRPGTKIKVPSIATLGIDPTDPAVIRKAKNRGIEIYKKYR